VGLRFKPGWRQRKLDFLAQQILKKHAPNPPPPAPLCLPTPKKGLGVSRGGMGLVGGVVGPPIPGQRRPLLAVLVPPGPLRAQPKPYHPPASVSGRDKWSEYATTRSVNLGRVFTNGLEQIPLSPPPVICDPLRSPLFPSGGGGIRRLPPCPPPP